MKVLFDTSVLIAAFLKGHQFHAEAAPWLSAARSGFPEMVVSAHTLAELYATLTRMPQGLKLPPEKLWKLVETDILSHATVRTLPATGYSRLIKRLASDGVIGATVYDAVIVEVARRARADAVLTLNSSHFRRIWPGNVNRILSPRESSPPTPDAD